MIQMGVFSTLMAQTTTITTTPTKSSDNFQANEVLLLSFIKRFLRSTNNDHWYYYDEAHSGVK